MPKFDASEYADEEPEADEPALPARPTRYLTREQILSHAGETDVTAETPEQDSTVKDGAMPNLAALLRAAGSSTGSGWPTTKALERLTAVRSIGWRPNEQMATSVGAILDAEAAKFRREAERDAHQRELVDLQRQAVAREAERDAQQAERDRVDRKRRRHEIYRWVFTTTIALCALTVAIIVAMSKN